MISANVKPPLTNLQVEMLRLFATKVPEKDLMEIRDMIARYLLERARDEADRIWDERGYTDEKLKELLEKNNGSFTDCLRHECLAAMRFSKVSICNCT